MVNTILSDDERPKMPEPALHDGVTISKRGKYTGTTDGYTAEQMEAYADAREAAVLAKLREQEPVAQERKALAKSMADKLMGWRLPDTFYPDGYVTFDREAASKQTALWPVGTNLFTQEQAVQMLLDIMPTAPEAPAQEEQ